MPYAHIVRRSRLYVLALALPACLGCPAAAQDPLDVPESSAAAATSHEISPEISPEISIDELRLRMLPLRRAELVEQAEAWVQRLEMQAKVYVEAQLAAGAGAGSGADAERLQADVRAARESGAHLLERLNAVVEALRQKGGDVEEYKQYAGTLATVMTIERQPEPGEAAEAAEAAEVEVPTLEPYDPLTVSPDELKLRLRRLSKPALEEEIETWLGRLQAKTEQIAAADIAARDRTGDDQAALIELATSLKADRTRLVERAQVAIDLFEARGGDATEHRQYVKTVTGGLAEDLSDLDVTEAGAVGTAWNMLVAWGKSPEGGLRVLANVVKFLGIMFVAWILAAVLARVAGASLTRFKRPSALLRRFVVTMTRRLVMIIGLVVAISKLGVNIGPLVAAIGAAGLVIGLALQGTLSNFASGLLILLYRPFDVGDAVEVSGVSGKVEAMTMVSTSIATFDNQLLVVPNNSVWNNIIKNVTGRPTRRVDMVFGISYSDDIEKSRAILEEIVASHDLVLDDPAPNIRLHELADSSVNFIVRPWARTSDYWEVYWDVTRQVKERFDAAGISIPFPQQEVHVHQVPAPSPTPSQAPDRDLETVA